MDEKQLKTMVERLIAEMLEGRSDTAEPRQQRDCCGQSPCGLEEGCLADITEIDLKKQLLVEHPHNAEALLAMKAKTPARLGIGRAGARYKTITMLRVRADHAAAQDSVFSDVDEEFVRRNGFVSVKTLCESKDQ